MNSTNLRKTHPISFRPLHLKEDASMLLEWVKAPQAKYWGMLEASQSDLILTYKQLLDIPNYEIYIGLVNKVPTFLMESYNPKTDLIAKHYDVLMGDCGMHLLMKPSRERINGFTWHVFSAIMDFLFEEKKYKRIVVEPDVQNEKIHRLNKRAGFKYQKKITLPHKVAFLAFCTIEQYQAQITALKLKGFDANELVH